MASERRRIHVLQGWASWYVIKCQVIDPKHKYIKVTLNGLCKVCVSVKIIIIECMTINLWGSDMETWEELERGEMRGRNNVNMVLMYKISEWFKILNRNRVKEETVATSQLLIAIIVTCCLELPQIWPI